MSETKRYLEDIEEKIDYARLLYIARKLHLAVFKIAENEKEIYDEIGLTDEENEILGYRPVGEIITNPEIAKKLKEVICRNIEEETDM